MKSPLVLLLVVLWGGTTGWSQETEVLLGGVTQSTRRAVRLGTSEIGTSSAALTGGELLVRGGGAGVYLRYLSGTFPSGQGGGASGELSLTDARLMIGPRVFNVEAGYHRRGHGGTSTEDFPAHWRVGARLQLDLGPSGLGVILAGSILFRSEENEGQFLGGIGAVGSEGETGLIYQAPRGLPFFARLGYRFAKFDSQAGMVEELSGVSLSGGLRWMSGGVK